MKSFEPLTPGSNRERAEAWQFALAVIAGGLLHVSGQTGANSSVMSIRNDLNGQFRSVFQLSS